MYTNSIRLKLDRAGKKQSNIDKTNMTVAIKVHSTPSAYKSEKNKYQGKNKQGNKLANIKVLQKDTIFNGKSHGVCRK